MKATSISIFLLSILFFTSCDDITNLKKERRGGFNEELRTKKIRRITQLQFVELALSEGNMLSDSAQKVLGSNLKKVVLEKGSAEAVSYCNINAYPLLEVLAKDNDLVIKRVSNNYRNENDKPNEMEKGILDAYQYNIENKISVEPSIQKTKTGFLYTKPIVMKDGLCLNCHGNETEIDKTTLENINQLYPKDLAKNHKIGDLRGMWSIEFSRKNLSKMMYM